MAKKRGKQNASGKNDDLKKIEGIGPKIAQLFVKNGIDSYAKLAKAPAKRLKQILQDAGPRYRMHDPTTWKRQAALARDGKWDELKGLQKKLDGGRRPKPKASPKKEQSESNPNSLTVFLSGIGGTAFEHGKPFVIERILSPEEVQAEYEARKSELEPEWERAEDAASVLWKRLKSLDEFERHITGISVRFRTKYGQPVSPLQVVVAVNVALKMTADELAEQDFTEIQELGKDLNVRIKVLEGTFELLDPTGILLTGNREPKEAVPFDHEVTGGIPVSPPNLPGAFGTLGVVMKLAGQSLGLTAQHVVGIHNDVDQLAPDGIVPSARIVAQRISPKRNAPYDVTIGAFTESVDAALIEVSEETGIVHPPTGNWARGVSHEITEQPSTAANPLPIYFATKRVSRSDAGRLELIKFGNGSGLKTVGVIDSVNQTMRIGSDEYVGNFSLERIPVSQQFATGGDSGAVIAAPVTQIKPKGSAGFVTENAMVVVGILFARLANSTRGIACSLPYVIKALSLDAKLPNKHFVDDWVQ